MAIMKKMTKLLLQSISPPFFGNNFQRHMTPIRRRRSFSLDDDVTNATTRSGSKQTRLFSCGHRDYFILCIAHSICSLYSVAIKGVGIDYVRAFVFFVVMVNPLYLHPRLHRRIW
ncbi:hypothetical protein ABFS83_14G234300 [Erythranthe nasuta]